MCVHLTGAGQAGQLRRAGQATLGDPGVHPHPLPRGAVPVLGVRRPAQHQGRVEVGAGVLPVAAVVGAAGAAQTVHGRAAHLLAGLRLRLEAGGRHAVPGWRDGLRLDADVGAGVDGEAGTLRNLPAGAVGGSGEMGAGWGAERADGPLAAFGEVLALRLLPTCSGVSLLPSSRAVFRWS